MEKKKLDELKEQMLKVFGPWVEGPMDWLIMLFLLAGACISALEIAEHFSNPELRWIYCAVLLLLSVLAIFLKKRISSFINPATGQPFTTTYKRFVFVSVGAGAFLATDLAFYLSEVPFEFSEPLSSGNSARIVMKKGDAKRLESIPVWSFFEQGELFPVSVNRFNTDTFLGFDLRKRDDVKKLVIHDVILSVEEYEPFPDFYAPVEHGAAYTEPIKLYYQIGKRKSPFPWDFSPSYVVRQGEVSAGGGNFTITDSIDQKVRIVVFAKDPGVYKVKVKLLVTKRFCGIKPYSLMEKPIGIGFFGKDSILAVKELPKLDAVWIGLGSEIEEYKDLIPDRLPAPVKPPKAAGGEAIKRPKEAID